MNAVYPDGVHLTRRHRIPGQLVMDLSRHPDP